MARKWISGFETGDFSEFAGSSAGTNSVQSTTVRTGGYAGKFNSGGVSYRESTTGLNLTTVFFRFYFFVASLPPALNNGEFFAGIANSSDLDIAKPGLNSNGTIVVINSSSGVNVTVATGTQIVNTGAWNLLEFKLVISAGSGIIETKLNGVLDTSTTGLTTNGRGNVDRVYVGPGAGDLGVDIYIDDIAADDAAYPDAGQVIARQPVTGGTPTYNTWIKSTGTDAGALWNDTPFTATDFCSDFISADAQTAVISSFGSTQTGHGTQVIASGDTITAFKTGLVAKTAFTTASGITQVGNILGTSSLNGVDITLTFSVAPIAGDVVYLWGGHTSTRPTPIGPSTAGYTQIGTTQTATTNTFGVWRKVMGVTPDTTVVGQGTGNASDSTGYGCIVLRQVNTATPEDVTIVFANGSSTNPDPGSITPATTGALSIICAGTVVSDSAWTSPANYGLTVAAGSADTNPYSIGGALRSSTLTGGVAENPASWTGVLTGVWIAATIAVRPALAAGSALSIRTRVNGSDTDSAEVLTVADAYYDNLLSVPALSSLFAMQLGALHGGTSALQTVEDVWAQVEYTPATITVGNWFNNFSDPPKPKAGLKTAAQLAAIYSYFTPVVVTVSVDSWGQPFSLPPGTLRGLQARYQLAHSGPLNPTVPFSYYNNLSEPVRQKIGLKTHLQSVTTTDPNSEFPIRFGYYNPLSEPVKLRRFNTALQASSIDSNFTPITTTIFADSWWQPFSLPVRQKNGIRYTLQDEGGYSYFTPSNVGTGDVLFSGSNEAAIFLSSLLYPSMQEPVPLAITATVTMGWIAPFADPVRFKNLGVYLQSSTVLDPKPEFPIRFGYYSHLSEPVRRRGIRPEQQQVLAIPYRQPNVTFGYYTPFSEPVRQKKGLSYTLQPTSVIPDRQPNVTFGFYGWLSEPQRSRKFNVASQPSAVGSPFPIVPPSIVNTGWYNWLDDPKRFKPGLAAALQQSLAIPSRIIVGGNITGTISAFQFNYDIAEISVFVRNYNVPTHAIVSIEEILGGYNVARPHYLTSVQEIAPDNGSQTSVSESSPSGNSHTSIQEDEP